MTAGRFQYKARSTEQWQRAGEGKFISPFLDQYEQFSPKDGNENWIRILPPTWPGAEHFGFTMYVHFGVGPDNNTIVCEQRSGPPGSKCPLCEEQVKAEAKGLDELSKDLKPTRRMLIWLIDRYEKDETKNPKLWAMPTQKMNDVICSLSKDRRTGAYIQVDHPYEGRDITFEVKGKRPNINYVAHALDLQATEVEEKYLEFVEANPLPTVLNHRSYEQVKAIYEGGNPTAVAAAEKEQATHAPQASVATSAPQPTQHTTASVQQQPPPIVIYCTNTQKFGGKLYGCTASVGHAGDCDYGREITATPQNGAAAQPTEEKIERKTEPQPASQQVSTASRLRSHFQTGK